MNKERVIKAYDLIIGKLTIAHQASIKSQAFNPAINDEAIKLVRMRLDKTLTQLKEDLKQFKKEEVSSDELCELKDRAQLLSASFGQSFALKMNSLICENDTNINKLKIKLEPREVIFYSGFVRPLSNNISNLTNCESSPLSHH